MFEARDRSKINAINTGIYVGKVKKVDGPTAYVEIPRLNPGFEYPAIYPAELYNTDTLLAPIDYLNPVGHSHTCPAGESDIEPPHVHRLRFLEAGDKVAVAFLESGRDELVILLRLP